MNKLDPHEEAISGRPQYQDPADLHEAVFGTGGWPEEEEEDGIKFFQGAAVGLGIMVVGYILLKIFV